VLGAGATTGAGCTTTVSCVEGGTYAVVVLVTSSVFELHPLMKGTAARLSNEIAIFTEVFMSTLLRIRLATICSKWLIVEYILP
jgi:hypothetical protein